MEQHSVQLCWRTFGREDNRQQFPRDPVQGVISVSQVLNGEIESRQRTKQTNKSRQVTI